MKTYTAVDVLTTDFAKTIFEEAFVFAAKSAGVKVHQVKAAYEAKAENVVSYINKLVFSAAQGVADDLNSK